MKIGKSSLPYLALLVLIISMTCFLEGKNRIWNKKHVVYEIKKMDAQEIYQQENLLTELDRKEHEILTTLNY